MGTDGDRVERRRDVGGPVGTTMRAVVQERYGSVDRLRLASIALPQVGVEDVLVRVHAAGLDRGTWHLMTGRPYLIRPVLGVRGPRRPVPGLDVAGTVVAVGSAVTRFGAGDEVFGFGRGSFAEYAVARQDKLARRPSNATFEQAAVVPVSAATALLAVYDAGRVRPGQHVLVTGASGGVGSYAVQLAKAAGAEVTGVASTGKLDLLRFLGADHVVDYGQEDWARGARRYDLVIDIAGNPPLSRLRRALTSTGTAVFVGGEHGGSVTGGLGRQLRGMVWSPFLRQRLTGFVPKERASDLERLVPFIEAGTVTPSVDRVFRLEEVPEAMRYLEAGRVRGKVAVTV